MKIIDKSEMIPNTVFGNLKNGDIFRAVDWDANNGSFLYMRVNDVAVNLYTFEISRTFEIYSPVILLDTELIISGVAEIDDYED